MFQQKRPGKVLLFGEYTLLNGGEALAIPLKKFGGWWEYAGLEDKQQDLIAFAHYLSKEASLGAILDIKAFETALSKSLYFNSNIPIGYGAGSSGALCAGVLKVFGFEKVLRNKSLTELKTIFSLMEGFFHGSSSGLDPLVSYLDEGILIDAKGELIPVDSFDGPKGIHTYLVDTRKARKTEPLVNWHLAKCKNETYQSALQTELLPQNNKAIAAYLNEDKDDFWKALHYISQFQLDHFTKMVPSGFHEIWKNGLSNDKYKMKICGAGGGGFMLLFAPSAPGDFPYELIDIHESPITIGAQLK